jgi:hypothetical protein
VNEKSACVAHFPLYALIVTNVTIVGNSEVEPALRRLQPTVARHSEANAAAIPWFFTNRSGAKA